jgi:hypothetical protein
MQYRAFFERTTFIIGTFATPRNSIASNAIEFHRWPRSRIYLSRTLGRKPIACVRLCVAHTCFDVRTPAHKRSMKLTTATGSWSELLKQTFAIDVETCPTCKGPIKLVSLVQERSLVRFLRHLVR